MQTRNKSKLIISKNWKTETKTTYGSSCKLKTQNNLLVHLLDKHSNGLLVFADVQVSLVHSILSTTPADVAPGMTVTYNHEMNSSKHNCL